MTKAPFAIRLSENQRQRISALTDAKGAVRAAALLDISKQTLDRALGGLTLHPWTVHKVEAAFRERDAEGKQP